MLVAGILIAVAIIALPILTFMFNSLLQNKQQDHEVGLMNVQFEFQQQMRIQDKMEQLAKQQAARRQHMAQTAEVSELIAQLGEVFGHLHTQPDAPRRSQDWRDDKEVEEGAGAHGG